MPWVDPSLCMPPHRVSHPEKKYELEDEFRTNGWSRSHPALVGYWYDDHIQLITGSHRWAAARDAGITIPVHIVPFDQVKDSWGDLESWFWLITPPSAQDVVGSIS